MNATGALKVLDSVVDVVRTTRSQASELLNDFSRKKIRASITFHIDSDGDIHPEMDIRLKGDSIHRLFLEKK